MSDSKELGLNKVCDKNHLNSSEKKENQDQELVFINCSYIPLEIVSAAGYVPYRNWPDDIGDNGQEMLPVDYCPYSRAFLSEIYKKNNKIITANSCDAMRRVYDVISRKRNYRKGSDDLDGIANDMASKNKQFLLQVPRKTSQMYVGYFTRKLKNMISYLEEDRDIKTSGPILKSEIDKYNNLRSLLKELRDNLIKSNNHTFKLLLEGIKYYFNQEKDQLEQLIYKTESDLQNKKIMKTRTTKPNVILSSSCLLDNSLIKLVEKLKLNIVGVDSCLGERTFDFQIDYDQSDTLNDLLFGMSEIYLNKPACPRIMEPEKRLEEIERLISIRNAAGIIYFVPKFCDQADYDFKYIKEWSEKNDFPILQIEGEYGAGTSGQLTTRIEAFKEALQFKYGDKEDKTRINYSLD